ncbi:MAG: hypothetical protein WDO17_00055 [Alphaproteobacteria bacterium]
MPESSALDRELNSDEVLRQEVQAIFGVDLTDEQGKGLKGDALYQRLNGLNGSALCLSGGGIRSATFGLGVIEALAAHPRQASSKDEGEKPCASAGESILRQFNYLSTVSGGGYIGSWLSAWIARAGYEQVWPKLIGRRDHPDQEPGETSWLRAYSNYLTPRLGLFSADTWTAVALYMRNLILNWLVILPAVVLALLAIKAFAVGSYGIVGGLYVNFGRAAVVGFVTFGVILLMVALRFALLNRPSAFARAETEKQQGGGSAPRGKDAHRNEYARVGDGGNERAFVKRCLMPALASALLLALYLVIRGPKLTAWPLAKLVLLSLAVGAVIYAAAWLWAWPPGNDHAPPNARRTRLDWLRDLNAWIVAGGVYGALIGTGVYILAHYDLWFVIGNINWPSATGGSDQPSISSDTGYFLIALIYGVPWIIWAQLTAEMIFVGLTNWQSHSDADREWFGRSTGYFTVVALMWLITMFLVLIAGELALAFLKKGDWAKYLSTVVAAGSALFSTLLGKSGKSSPTEQKDKSGLFMRLALPAGAIVFLTMLVLAISCLIDYLLFDVGLVYSSLLGAGAASKISEDVGWLVLGFLITGFVAAVAWLRVNINRFSIHALYRNRLIRGYLGASNPERRPNPFTGFDSSDNIRMPLLWRPGEWQPFHVVNIALNVVNSKRLAWQERKAESFTATPLHCGTAELGYRSSHDYGDKERGGMSLGTAFAISGAAASPSMGYHSSPIVSLLLALFNVRLGWWLGNPGPKGAPHYYQSDGPKVAIFPFIAEMFGLTTDDRHYVYLSDGGHFENLGLYEMIRRRCRCIVVSDAGCDPNYGFEDLGNAVRKIAIDLGVEIRFGRLHELKGRAKDGSVIKGAYYAVGEIDYKTAPEWKSAADDYGARARNGTILYVKPGYHGTESAGVVAYATANAAFPHETTADQFFSESQFESYRTLGFEIMDGVLKNAAENVDTIADAGILSPAPARGNLCDLIRALDSELVRKAEVALKPAPTKLANVVSALDESVIAELRTALSRDDTGDVA